MDAATKKAIENIFYQNSDLFVMANTFNAFTTAKGIAFSLYVVFRNDACAALFTNIIRDALHFSFSYTNDGSGTVEYHSDEDNQISLDSLTRCFQDYRDRLAEKTMIATYQSHDIYRMFKSYRNNYFINAPTFDDVTVPELTLTFVDDRHLNNFKKFVAERWNIASYTYSNDPPFTKVKILMDNPLGFKQFEPKKLAQYLKEMNRENQISIDECNYIFAHFKTRLKEMNISVEGRVGSIEERPLDLWFDFNTTQQLEAFQKEVLPYLKCTHRIQGKTISISFEKSTITEENLKACFDHMKSHFVHVDDSFSFLLFEAIERGRAEPISYPYATTNVDAEGNVYLCIVNNGKTPQNNQEIFDKFINDFPLLCYKNKIEQHDNRTQFTQRKELPGDLIKYEFYISLEQLHDLLMNESSAYVGYRNSGEHSVTTLVDRPFTMKEDELCLFPILVTAPDQFLIRNAGCNFSEVISVQLSFLFKEYLPELTKGLSPYGHHQSQIMATLCIDSRLMLTAALMSAGLSKADAKDRSSHQAQDGTEEILSQNDLFLKEMTPIAKEIYRNSAVSSDELENLHSFEVPIVFYLSQLVFLLKEKIEAQDVDPAVKENIQFSIKNIEVVIGKLHNKDRLITQQIQLKSAIQANRPTADDKDEPATPSP